jgi:hypothetical protein
LNSIILSSLIIILIFVGCSSPRVEKRHSSIDQIQRATNGNPPREIHDDETKEEYLQFIVSSQNYVFWKNYYPKQTLFSILNFPIEKIDKHLADTFQCYLKLDFDAATDFLKKQDLATKHKDLAIEIIARSLKDDELAMAVLWAQDIHDVAKRHSLIEEFATH